MAETSGRSDEPDPASRFPAAQTILIHLVILVATLTWTVPAGQYDRAMNEEIGDDLW